MKTGNFKTAFRVTVMALAFSALAACSHDQPQTGKDDGTGTIMDDGTTNKHRGDTTNATNDMSKDTAR